MALRGASTTTDSDFIDWMSLATEGAAVVCSVRSIEPEKDYGQGTPVAVPRARIIVLTGKQAGVVFDEEMIFKAGIRNKLTEVGDDVVGRVATYTRGKQVHPCLNNEADGDIELAEAALAKHNGGKASTSKKAAKNDDSDEPPF